VRALLEDRHPTRELFNEFTRQDSTGKTGTDNQEMG